LAVSTKRASDPVAKLIKQAIGNAIQLHAVSPDSLIIDSAYATKGRTLKRAHIGGRGRTKPYERTAAHLTLNLRVEEAVKAPEAKAIKTKKNTK
jgi:large subunit ribosomal protein L22